MPAKHKGKGGGGGGGYGGPPPPHGGDGMYPGGNYPGPHHHHHHQHQHHQQPPPPPQAAPVPVHHSGEMYGGAYQPGEEVSVFYRYEYDGSGDRAEAYFPVSSAVCGQGMPRMGKTDCWQPATVAQAFNPETFDPNMVHKTGVLVRLLHPLWYNRHGNVLDVSSPKNTEVRVHPADVVRGPPPPPQVSFVVVRWGGHFRTPDYNELAGEDGGWGDIGTSISDGYIRNVFDRVYLRLGNTYEVLTCYVGGKRDLDLLTGPSVVSQLHGELKAGCYFLWPNSFVDGSSRTPGFVEKDALFKCMSTLECSGVETAFPHPSPLYKALVSKDWCSYTCVFPEFRVPATTKVMRSSIHRSSEEAAATALAALGELSNSNRAGEPIKKGVAKLGYSWEASDVLSWKGKWDLSKKLEHLVTQPGCEADNVIVQEFIESNLEIRCYCLEGKPVKLLYTKFCENTDGGSFTAFKSMSRDYAIKHWYGNCEQAMAHAESEICKAVRLLSSSCSCSLSLIFFPRFGTTNDIHASTHTHTGPGMDALGAGSLLPAPLLPAARLLCAP